MMTMKEACEYVANQKKANAIHRNNVVAQGNRRVYQINKQKLNYRLNSKNYFYTRELVNNPEERVKMLYAFNQKNCV